MHICHLSKFSWDTTILSTVSLCVYVSMIPGCTAGLDMLLRHNHADKAYKTIQVILVSMGSHTELPDTARF